MKHGRISLAGWVAICIGLIWGIVQPMGATANSYWIELDGSDFDCGTYSSTHLLDISEGLAYIHLEDNSSETHVNNNNANSVSGLPIDPGSGQNIWVQTYSQSFCPTFSGVVDKIELQVFKVGTPLDAIGNAAYLTIKLNTANQNSPHNPLGTTLIQVSYPASSIPGAAGGWTTFYLAEPDSYQNTVLSANWYYAIVVTSNAVNDINNEFRWEYAVVNNANTDAMEKGYDANQETCWHQCVSGGNHYDYQFKIYVHDFVHSGNFISQVHDFGQNVNFIAVEISYRDVSGGSVTMYTRCGSSSTPDETWCDWIDQGTGNQNPGMDPARYAQYKLEFIAGTNDDTTYSVYIVEIEYV